jgi:tetratricopeptide (TPR) repeat protein
MPVAQNTNSPQEPQDRGLQLALPTSYATYVNRWAIVVGVSKYKHEILNLKYADRDAEALYELLLTPSGGGFAKENVTKLVNEEATTANITRALRSFLKNPDKEDIVLIYFACHGSPDRDRPGVVYFLTHDADPVDIAGTALPMREIDLSLKENLLAERVIILVDACHSAAIGGGIGRRSADDNSGVVNKYLHAVSETRSGIALLTSAEGNEVSFEDVKWGGGHGVFTHYLLEGMKFEYVRDNVKRATENRQHPCIGTNSYDRNLPVAITAGIAAQEHYELGYQLYQIGLKLDDKDCFEAAVRHFKEAIQQAKSIEGKLPEAHLQLGLALTATGNLPAEAVIAFDKAIQADIPDAAYHLGIAYLNQGEGDEARKYLELFLSNQPDSDKAGAVQELISWLDASNTANPQSVKRHALLIGMDYPDLEDPHYSSLVGCVNDSKILGEVLSEKYGFKVTMLLDMEATYENIINAFRELQEQTSSRDVVIIYYCGNSGGDGHTGSWIAADTKLNDEGDRLNIITTDELYQFINAIPGINRGFERFMQRVNKAKLCSLFFSGSLGQLSYDVKIDGTDKRHGAFTYALVQELHNVSDQILQRDLFEKVKKTVEKKAPQTPCFVGSLDRPLFFAQNLNHCPDLFTFSQRRCYSAFDDKSLQNLCQKTNKQFTTMFPDFYYSLGLAFLEKSNNTQALSSLGTAVQYANYHVDEKIFALSKAQLNNQRYKDSAQTLQQYIETAKVDTSDSLFRELGSAIDHLHTAKPRALLIGIDTYLNAEAITPIQNAVSDTLALQNALIEHCGFQPENIKVLLNQEATYQNILKEFGEIVNLAEINPSFFYFAGNGSVDGKENPTILAFDSRYQGIPDIPLKQLSQITNQTEASLTSVIDSSWTNGAIDNDGRVMLDHIENRRYVQCDQINALSSRKAVVVEEGSKIDRSNSQIPQIGYISIYPESIRYCNKDYLGEELTTPLILFLKESNPATCTYQQLLKVLIDANKLQGENDTANDQGKICLISKTDSLNQTIFGNDFLESKARDYFIKVEQVPIRNAVLILERLIEQRNNIAPEAFFELGIAYYSIKEYDKSITALQTAIDQVSGNSTVSQGQPAGQQAYPEAHYWLGRVLYETKSDPARAARAVSELRVATQQDPTNATAHYFLGQALRAFVEQNILIEAEQAFQTYLNTGTPIAPEDDIQEFLKSRKKG